MDRFKATLNTIGWSLDQIQTNFNLDQLEDLLNLLKNAYSSNQKIFVYGVGRSLLVGKAFSMRLMHLGYASFVIGETVTPAVSANDVFIVISNTLSGKSVSAAIEVAQQLQAKIVIVSSMQEHILSQKATISILIPNFKTSIVRKQMVYPPLGTLFELLTQVLLDCIVAELMYQLTISEEEMLTRHANIQE